MDVHMSDDDVPRESVASVVSKYCFQICKLLTKQRFKLCSCKLIREPWPNFIELLKHKKKLEEEQYCAYQIKVSSSVNGNLLSFA